MCALHLFTFALASCNTMHLKVSVVLPTYDKLSRLKLTLAALCHQTGVEGCFEVILIDDGDSSETACYIETRSWPFPLHYHPCQVRMGRAAARNKGISFAQHDVVLFIDDDVIFPPNFIFNHIALQKIAPSIIHGQIFELPYLRYFSDPSHGVLYSDFEKNVASTLKLKKFCITEEDLTLRFDSVVRAQARRSALEKAIEALLTNHPGKVDWLALTGANVSLPLAWLKKVDGFDEAFGLHWGCEDLELGYRLSRLGYPFYYAKEAMNFHLSHRRRQLAEEHAINTDYFYLKHQDPFILLFQRFVNREVGWKALLQMATFSQEE